MSLWFFSRGDRQTRWQTFTGRLHMLRSQWHDISSKQDFLEGPVAVEGRRTSAEKCCPSFNSATEPKQKPHPFCLITPLCSMCSTYPPKPIYQRNDRLSMCWQAARLSEQPVWHVCFPASNTNSTCSGVLTARSGPPTVQLEHKPKLLSDTLNGGCCSLMEFSAGLCFGLDSLQWGQCRTSVFNPTSPSSSVICCTQQWWQQRHSPVENRIPHSQPPSAFQKGKWKGIWMRKDRGR